MKRTLEQIRDEMLELLEEAKHIVTGHMKEHPSIYNRMMAYWYPHIQCALTPEHDFLSEDFNMQEAIDALDGSNSLEALVKYAEDAGVEADALAIELNIDRDNFGPAPTVKDVIKYELEHGDENADFIRESIDRVEAPSTQ
jgi:hypothetical protein